MQIERIDTNDNVRAGDVIYIGPDSTCRSYACQTESELGILLGSVVCVTGVDGDKLRFIRLSEIDEDRPMHKFCYLSSLGKQFKICGEFSRERDQFGRWLGSATTVCRECLHFPVSAHGSDNL